MATSPQWKVYRDGEYVGSCKYAEDAAALVGVSGGTVKHGHSLIVWREGAEEFSAADSYDGAALIMEQRRYAAAKAAYERVHGPLESANG